MQANYYNGDGHDEQHQMSPQKYRETWQKHAMMQAQDAKHKIIESRENTRKVEQRRRKDGRKYNKYKKMSKKYEWKRI